MRGRTNVNNGGIIPNATTDTYEIASGETILAGDFVDRYSYVTNSLDNIGVNERGSYIVPTRSDRIFKMSDGNYLHLGEKTNLYHIDQDGVVTRVWNEKNTKYLDSTYILQLDADTLLGNIKNTNATLVHYNPSDNTLETRDITYQSIGGGGTELMDTWLFETQTSNQYRFFIKGHSSNYVYAGTGLMTISGNDYSDYSLSFSSKVTGTRLYTESDYQTNGMHYVAKISSDIYLIGFSSNSHTFYTYREGDNAFSNYLSSSTFGFSSMILKMNCEDGYVDYFSQGTRRREYFDVTKLPTIDGNVFPTESIFSPRATDYYNMILIEEDNGDYTYLVLNTFIQSTQATRYAIFPMVLKANGTIIKGEETELVGQPTTQKDYLSLMTSKLENNRLLMNVGTMLYVIAYEDGIFKMLNTTVKQVKRITSDQYIKGVAKQSGNAGDTIEVYVPSTSY